MNSRTNIPINNHTLTYIGAHEHSHTKINREKSYLRKKSCAFYTTITPNRPTLYWPKKQSKIKSIYLKLSVCINKYQLICTNMNDSMAATMGPDRTGNKRS